MTCHPWTPRLAAAPGVLACVALLSGGCAVHHHHHYPPESQTPSEVPGAQVEKSERDTSPSEVETQVEDPGALPTSTDSPVPSNASAGRFEPFEGCVIEDDVTGWVVVDCPGQNYLVQTGPTMRGSFDRRFAYAGELAVRRHPHEVSYWGREDEVRLNQTRYRAMRFELRENIAQGFGSTRPHREGAVVAEGMYAAADSALGAIGMLCVEDGELDRAECVRVFEALSSAEELPFGKPYTTQIEVLGWRLESEGECYFSKPGRIDCMTGHLSWTYGSRSELEEQRNATIALWTDDGGIAGFHNPHTREPCEVAGQTTTCHRVEYKGVRDEPGEILHLAMVREGAQDVLVRCSYSTRHPVPAACLQAFRDAHVAQNSPSRTF